MALVAPVALLERLTTGKLLGVLLGFSGVYWVMVTRLGANDTLSGMAWVATGVLSLILGTLLFKWYPPREPLLVVNGVQLLMSGVILAPLALLDAPPSAIHASWQLFYGLAYVTIFVNIVGVAIWLWLLHHGEASKVSAYYFVTPIIGLALSAALLGDDFGRRELTGLAAVAGAIYLVNRRNRSRLMVLGTSHLAPAPLTASPESQCHISPVCLTFSL